MMTRGIDMKNIHENLKRFRLEKNLTQQEVADMIYVTRQCVSKWEQGKSIPDIYMLEKLAGIYDKKLSDLIDEASILDITIDYASKKNKRDQMNLIGILISVFAVILTTSLGIMIYQYVIKNQNPLAIHSYKAQIISFEDFNYQLLLEDDEEITLNFQSLTHLLYNHDNMKIYMDDLKIEDILLISYQGEVFNRDIVKVLVFESKVEEDLLGVFVSTNNIIYTSIDQMPVGYSTLPRDGFIYFMFDHEINHTRWETNASLFEYSYERINKEFSHLQKIQLNVYFDPSKLNHEIKYGKITSTGIHYLGTLEPIGQLVEVIGEIGYEPNETFGLQSIDVQYEIHLHQMASFDELIIYEYDENHLLIDEVDIDNGLEVMLYQANVNTLYGMIKVTYQKNHPFRPMVSYSYQLMLGEKITIPISDIYGIVRKEQLILK